MGADEVRMRVPFWSDPGVVLHQPLNCSIFWKNSDFCQKMNGPPVSPDRNLQNAPTWRVPNPLFWTPFLGHFGRRILLKTPPPHPNLCRYCLSNYIHTFKSYLSPHSFMQSPNTTILTYILLLIIYLLVLLFFLWCLVEEWWSSVWVLQPYPANWVIEWQ